MCGPFAMLATRDRGWWTVPMYHLGRLTTYSVIGVLAGMIGSRIDLMGSWLGWTSLAARLAGAFLFAWAVYRLLQLWRPAPLPWTSTTIAQGIAQLRPLIGRLSPAPRALVIGAATTLLPCGWLYLYVIVAAGAASAAMGWLVMFVFWIGTLPALTALAIGWQALAARYQGQRWLPLALASMMLVAGGVTMLRGDTALTSWAQRFHASAQTSSALERLERSADTLPPCCE
jgi:sulfite exporter TauE/SafE